MRTVRDTHINLPACGPTPRWRYVLARSRPFAVLARLALLTFAVLLPVRIIEAQPDPLNETWRWARYGTESGLPSDRVLDVVETSNGVSWARTEVRLAWYDAYQWHAVTIVEGSTPQLPTRIVSDRHGGILAVASRRLYRVDQQGVSRIPIEEETGRLVVRDVIPLDDEELLVLTSGGLYRHHPGGLDPFPAPAGMAPEEIAISLFLTEAEGVWLTTPQGLFHWTGEDWVKPFNHATRFLRVGSWGRLAAVVDGAPTEYGLWTWTPGSPPRRLAGEGQGLITSLHAGPAGDAVVTYASGQVWVRRDGQWAWLTPVPLPLINPRFIRSRRHGDLWIGAEEGLFLFHGSASRWKRWHSPKLAEVDNINAILLARNGDVWMGTGAGLLIRHADGTFEHITAIRGTPLRVVTGLAEDREGGIWVASGSSFAGAFRWHRKAWTRVGAEAGLDAPRIHKIAKDRSGQLWFLGLGLQFVGDQAEPGAFVYDGARFTRWGLAEGMPSGRVYDFAEGPDGARWFATLKGLSRYHDRQWTHWTTDEGLLDKRVFTLTVGAEGRLWFGHQSAGHGLGTLDEQGRPHYLTVADGLIDDEVWEVQTGPDSTLWIGTGGGLSRYRDGTFASFGPSTGLEHRQVWPVLPLEDQVYVGTIGGGVYLLSLDERPTPLPLITVAPPLAAPGHVYFQWQAFAFQGRQPSEEVETRYRLDAQPWSAWSVAREARALNVPPGTHTFTVQAKSLFGVFAPEGTTASFQIAPPFYRHPLFLAAVLLWLLSMSVLGLSYWRRHRRSKEALRLSQARLEAAQARAKMGSWEYYPETRAGYWSKEMFHIYGLDPASDYPSMSTFLELIHPEDRQRVQTSQMQSLYTLEPISIDYRTNPAQGPERHLNATVHTVKDQEGRPIYLAGTVMDITERKEAEALREQLIAELETKNAELERFTYTVSHDLKSPLVTIKGFVGLLEQDAAAGNTERMKRDIEHINHATDKMHRLLGELLELSRIGRLMNLPEAVALSELAQEAATLVAGRLVAHGVEVEIAPEMPVIYGDRLRLLEVYQNLIDNAAKFMGDQRAPRLEIGARQNGSEVECWVRDNGLGIAAMYHEKIFGLFERLEAEGESTGIGLALVKRIVEVHGGRIWVESEGRGQGSTFYFTLPPKEP